MRLNICPVLPPQIQALQDEKEEVQEELEAAQKELGAERAASATLRRQVLPAPLSAAFLHIASSTRACSPSAASRQPPLLVMSSAAMPWARSWPSAVGQPGKKRDIDWKSDFARSCAPSLCARSRAPSHLQNGYATRVC